MLIVSTCIYVSFFLFFPLSFLKRPLTFFLCSRSSPLASPAFFELPQLLIALSHGQRGQYPPSHWFGCPRYHSQRSLTLFPGSQPLSLVSVLLDPLCDWSLTTSSLFPLLSVGWRLPSHWLAPPFSACVSRGPWPSSVLLALLLLVASTLSWVWSNPFSSFLMLVG